MPKTDPYAKPTKRAPKPESGRQAAPKKQSGRRMSREELSRHEREVRTNRTIMLGMGAVALLVVVILALGWFREYVAKGSESVANVAGRPITIERYARMLDFRRKATEQQMQYMQFQLQASSTQQGEGTGSLTDLFRQQIQQLQFSLILLPEQTLDAMIDDELIRQEAERRGLTVTQEEIEAETKETFGDPPTPVPLPSPTAAPGQPTPTAQPSPTPGPSPSPAPTADVEARLDGYLSAYDLSASDYRAMIEAQILRDKLQKAIGANVPTTEEQVRARHILVDDEEKAKEIAEKLKGGASFEELAKAESKDTSNKDKGGDLGWFTRGRMVAEFETVAFELEPKKPSDPVKTSFGWHIIEVLEKDANRVLDESMLESRKNETFNDWLSKARTGPEIKRELTEDQKNWVYRQMKWSPPA